VSKNLYLLIIGAIAGMVIAVVLVNSGMEEGTHSYEKFDDTVGTVMTDWFKSPPAITEHGWNVDRMMVFVHVLMGILFVGWSIYFLGCLLKFRQSAHPKADNVGPSKLWTTLAEYGVIVVEVVLILSFAVPLWNDMMNDKTIADIKKDAASDKGLEIHILAKQFDWNARYAGIDNKFEAQNINFANKVDNPFGLDQSDAENDDVTVLSARDKDNTIMVPVDTPVALKITSMDVIHSFKVLPLRVCKDAIPGLQLPIHFKANVNYLGLTDNEKKTGDWEGIYPITCAQLCGDGHGYMIGYLKVLPKDKFKVWLKEESEKQRAKRGEASTVVAKAAQ